MIVAWVSFAGADAEAGRSAYEEFAFMTPPSWYLLLTLACGYALLLLVRLWRVWFQR